MYNIVKIDCPSCGSRKFKVIYEDNPSNIVECVNCELCFFNPQPTAEYLQEYYSSDKGYMPSIEENFISFKKDPSGWKSSADFIFSKILKHLNTEESIKILDVGSAYGFFLSFAKERGHEIYGVEVSKKTSLFSKELGLNVQNCTLLEANFAANFFNLITMNNVLEHTLNPAKQLARAHDLLSNNGLIYIAVPNYDSIVSRVDKFFWKMKSWPNHLFYFTEKTLSRFLEQSGFKILEVFSQAGESDLNDDIRIIKDRFTLKNSSEIDQMIKLLWSVKKGQELVIIAQKGIV